MSSFKKIISTLTVAVFLAVSAPGIAMANENGTESGDDAAIILDLLILRPIGLVGTVVGTLFFVGSLPISLPTLSVGKTFNALVISPAKYTFVRELGTTP